MRNAVIGAAVAIQVFDRIREGRGAPTERDMQGFVEEATSIAEMACAEADITQTSATACGEKAEADCLRELLRDVLAFRVPPQKETQQVVESIARETSPIAISLLSRLHEQKIDWCGIKVTTTAAGRVMGIIPSSLVRAERDEAMRMYCHVASQLTQIAAENQRGEELSSRQIADLVWPDAADRLFPERCGTCEWPDKITALTRADLTRADRAKAAFDRLHECLRDVLRSVKEIAQDADYKEIEEFVLRELHIIAATKKACGNEAPHE